MSAWQAYRYESNSNIHHSSFSASKKKIDGNGFELILSPSSIPCARLKTNIPIIFWTDATFDAITDYYPGDYSNISRYTRTQGHALERRAIDSAAICIYASEWAAKSAINFYHADPSKVKVIPLGANLFNAPSRADIVKAIANRATNCCHILFIGVDWKRKGGDDVIETAKNLVAMGMNVIVDIVGCHPIGTPPPFVRCHGFVSKSSPAGEKKIHELMLSSHFLFVPSTAECYGLVYAEASAYGLPSLARATGGVTSVIKNNKNGIALPIGKGCKDFAHYISNQMNDITKYKASAISAREYYEQELSWDISINKFEICIRSLALN